MLPSRRSFHLVPKSGQPLLFAVNCAGPAIFSDEPTEFAAHRLCWWKFPDELLRRNAGPPAEMKKPTVPVDLSQIFKTLIGPDGTLDLAIKNQ